MKLLKSHSYEITKLFINQIGMTIFGLVLTFSTAMLDSTLKSAFTLWVSIFSLCFYLYLVYVVAWDYGAKDKIRVESGRIPEDRFLGLKLMAFAQVPNAVMAILLWLGAILRAIGGGFCTSIGTVLYGIGLPVAEFGQAMYLGIVMRFFDKEACFLNAVIYTLTMLPPLLASFAGYWLGLRDIRFLTSPEKPKNK